MSVWTWLALGGFVGVAVASLAILWPKHWELTADPRSVIEDYADAKEAPSIDRIHRDLALYRYTSFIKNEKGLEQLAVFFQLASALLTAEVLLWIVVIASRS